MQKYILTLEQQRKNKYLNAELCNLLDNINF